jgi:hypothetical protein
VELDLATFFVLLISAVFVEYVSLTCATSNDGDGDGGDPSISTCATVVACPSVYDVCAGASGTQHSFALCHSGRTE